MQMKSCRMNINASTIQTGFLNTRKHNPTWVQSSYMHIRIFKWVKQTILYSWCLRCNECQGELSMKQDHWSKIKLNLGSALWSKNTINSAGVSSPSVQTCGLFSYCLHFRLWWQSGRHISGVEGLGTGGRWQLSLCSFYSPRGLNCSHCAEWWASLRHFFISV